MSHKHPGKPHQHGASSDVARRLLAKGNVKDALKEARSCCRAGETAENRQLLEEIYLARVQQLQRFGQMEEAKAVFSDLQKFGPRNAQVRQAMDRMRVLLGDTGGAACMLLESTPELLFEIADQAILNSRLTVPKYGDLPVQVAAVRDALAAVSRGDDVQARELLGAISRSSPLADWKLFVRGLEAFYGRDDERLEANWSRLDSRRPASRIARTLKAAAQQPPSGVAAAAEDPQIADGLLRLSSNSPSSGFINALKELMQHWDRADREQLIESYRQLKQAYGRSHATQIRQIVDFFWKSAVRGQAGRLLRRLMAIGPAPDLDPNWNRVRALFEEQRSGEVDMDVLRPAWLAYLEDLAQVQCLSDGDRRIARALVLRRLARHCRLAGEYFNSVQDEDDNDGIEISGNQEIRDAIEYYQDSIAAWPQLETSALELADVFESTGDSDSAVAVMVRLAEQNPDQFEAASWLSRYFLAQGDPGKAEPFVSTVRRLRPRDPQIADLVWQQKLAMIRHLAVKRQYDAARQAAEAAIAFMPPGAVPGTLDVLRAGIEFRAADPEAAHRFLHEAAHNLQEPTLVWLQMSSIAARLALPRGLRKEFDERLKLSLANKPCSETAGHLCRFLVEMQKTHTRYVGRATHERLVAGYLRRVPKKLRWQSADLKAACEFLAEGGSRHVLLRNEFLRIGMLQCSSCPQFFFWSAQDSLNRRSTMRSNLDLSERWLTTAVTLHESGPDKLTDEQFNVAMALLSDLRDLIDRKRRMDTFRFDDDEDFDDDDDIEDDDDDGVSDDDVEFEETETYGQGGRIDWFGDSPQAKLGIPEPSGFSLPPDFLDENGCVSGENLEMMVRMFGSTMPPMVKRQIAKAARELGMSEQEATADFLQWMIRNATSQKTADDGSPGRSARGARAARKRRRR